MNEILLIVDAVSREKGVPKEVIFEAIEAALATATRKRHAGDIDARVAIHHDTGDYDTFRVWEVLEDDAEIEFTAAMNSDTRGFIQYQNVVVLEYPGIL